MEHEAEAEEDNILSKKENKPDFDLNQLQSTFFEILKQIHLFSHNQPFFIHIYTQLNLLGTFRFHAQFEYLVIRQQKG